MNLGREAIEYECPSCKSIIVTETTETISGSGWLAAFLMCVAVPLCICAWIPLIKSECKTTSHRCPECGAHLGRLRGEAECCY